MAKPLVVDFTDVETGGRARVPEDDYRFKVTDVKVGEAKSSGNSMLIWTFEITNGKLAGQKLTDRTVLNAKSLWKLKQVLEAMGLKVPSKKVALNLRNYIGRELAGTVVDEEYNNRMQSTISDYFTVEVFDGLHEDEDVDEDVEDEEEEEEPAPKPKKAKKAKKSKKAKKPVSDEEDDEEIEELDLDDM